MKKLFERRDATMLALSALPAVITFTDNFIISDMTYVFRIIAFPVITILIGIFTGKYLSTLLCGALAFALQTTAIMSAMLLPYSTVNMLGLDYELNFLMFCAAFTLGMFAVRGAAELIMKITHTSRSASETGDDRPSGNKAVRVLLITVSAADIAVMLLSLLFWKGTQTTDSIIALLVLAAAAFSAFPIIFLIVVLPRQLRFSIALTAVYLTLFLIVYFVLLYHYTILPDTMALATEAVLLAIALIALAVAGLLIKALIHYFK